MLPTMRTGPPDSLSRLIAEQEMRAQAPPSTQSPLTPRSMPIIYNSTLRKDRRVFHPGLDGPIGMGLVLPGSLSPSRKLSLSPQPARSAAHDEFPAPDPAWSPRARRFMPPAPAPVAAETFFAAPSPHGPAYDHFYRGRHAGHETASLLCGF